MTRLARSCRHIASSVSLARPRSSSARSISMYLPCRTCSTPPKPSAASECCTALPCGSRTPGLSVTCTLAFSTSIGSVGGRARSLHHLRPLHVGGAALGKNAEPARDLLVGVRELAEVAAEPLAVEALVGADVPKPAGIRADLVG